MNNTLNGSIDLANFTILAAILFIIGICGIFMNRKSIINILMSIELILLSVNINFVTFSVAFNDVFGQIFTIFVLTVAAAEAAIGLAITVVYFRNKKNIDVENINEMSG